MQLLAGSLRSEGREFGEELCGQLRIKTCELDCAPASLCLRDTSSRRRPAASIGMRQFSAPARESCDTPGCSLLYGHAGVHFFARNRRPPDVLDPAAQPPGPSVRQPVTAARLAASTHMVHALPHVFSRVAT